MYKYSVVQSFKTLLKKIKFLLICKTTKYIVYLLENTMQCLSETKYEQNCSMLSWMNAIQIQMPHKISDTYCYV